jgi:hypothetical protein
VHKLIVSRRRREGSAKRDKDIQQAAALFDALSQMRPHELKRAWQEAYERGSTWRQLLVEGMSRLPPQSRDLALRVIDGRSAMLPGQ